ncbi:DUF397 domain-containing protein [Actinomadura adrarensis]|uniref:DUF397 domain-containing protein n=1 Tax=Actinomadura adrarensis TaxID=1819600 RepID=A0ABW3CTA9_9ACTN
MSIRQGDGPFWRKSSHSAQGADCVEIAEIAGTCAVRDSKDHTGPVLTFTRSEWSVFLTRTRSGHHDLR